MVAPEKDNPEDHGEGWNGGEDSLAVPKRQRLDHQKLSQKEGSTHKRHRK